ncbi:retron system putative HNH endonuclease [Candidatus Marithioploca araucensis]|uniref:Retron system putative HNH endonuclease n=1 Tax=Candidatus Marithioploca araucensis TaxID=70273 RepID=A0ABT7VUV6_9GAMM|nr:retron system putative HNH endonuclease [Candidatus Marithioploca araucensis]
MRFINKEHRNKEFDKYILECQPNSWKNVITAKKLTLHKHLWVEQKGLCIYCEQAIPFKRQKSKNHPSHIEHVKPKGDERFKHLEFDQNNLAVSCNGSDCHLKEVNENNFCGHIKDRAGRDHIYDEQLFLHPFENKDIENCFAYDMDGNITAANETEKADYTINLLELQHPDLIDMRRTQYQIFLEEMANGEDVNDLLNNNVSELPSFYSMLKNFFVL